MLPHRMTTRGARMAVLSILTFGNPACAGRAALHAPPDSGTRSLTFRNMTEDEVRVYVYEGARAWFIGHVEAFRSARLALPTDLVMHPGRIVTVAAVPVGGRGRDGSPTTGAIVRSDGELIEHVAELRWTLSGHTLSTEPVPHR